MRCFVIIFVSAGVSGLSSFFRLENSQGAPRQRRPLIGSRLGNLPPHARPRKAPPAPELHFPRCTEAPPGFGLHFPQHTHGSSPGHPHHPTPGRRRRAEGAEGGGARAALPWKPERPVRKRGPCSPEICRRGGGGAEPELRANQSCALRLLDNGPRVTLPPRPVRTQLGSSWPRGRGGPGQGALLCRVSLVRGS